MGEYSIKIDGEGEADEVRAAFEDAVRALRPDAGTSFAAELLVDEQAYTEDDVPEQAAADEAEGEDDDEPTEAEEAEPAGGEG